MLNNCDRYLETFNGRKLLELYKLNTEGMWQVYGEDPDGGMALHRSQPNLGIYTGRLCDILQVVTEMPNFWSCGSGGNLHLVRVITITENTASNLRKLKAEREKLLDKLNILNKELGLQEVVY
jgi:hypothetical protein